MTPQVQTEKIYYVDITALEENFSPLAGTAATIGADSPMVLTCAGAPHFVDAGQTFDVNCNTAGKLGVSLLARDTLVPSSFWIRAHGMDNGARVDTPAGPQRPARYPPKPGCWDQPEPGKCARSEREPSGALQHPGSGRREGAGGAVDAE